MNMLSNSIFDEIYQRVERLEMAMRQCTDRLAALESAWSRHGENMNQLISGKALNIHKAERKL